MTKDVIELAREACGAGAEDPLQDGGMLMLSIGEMQRLAALVAARERERLTSAAMESASKAIDAAVSMTIERCARVCDDAATRTWQNPRVYAAAIRALNTEGDDAAMAQKGGE